MVSETRSNKVILTNDGSNSIFSEQFNCTYHSVHGAMQESQHIFISAGLDFYLKKSGKNTIKVLEFGFGTGLNALLSMKYSVDKNIHIDYSTIEAFPVSEEIFSQLNFIAENDLNTFAEEFIEMHNTCEPVISLNRCFSFSKYIARFEDFSTEQQFDLIFYDAFGPDEQPHLWARPFLDKIPHLLNENGVLVTYCVKGSFKRALSEIGFAVNKIPGPIGKREILRAEKL
ncbi:MAG: tRNA (5-methylaminomethyl-2-thiouridine)(34)-methyltransferase MnmD [Deltaproteobacteria bacterium]